MKNIIHFDQGWLGRSSEIPVIEVIASYHVRYLARWETQSGGTALTYFTQSDASKFVENDLKVIREEIERHAKLNLS